jgi:hypothetical protein
MRVQRAPQAFGALFLAAEQPDPAEGPGASGFRDVSTHGDLYLSRILSGSQQIPQRRLYFAVIGSPKANSRRASLRQNPTKGNSAQMKRKRFSVEQIVVVLKQLLGVRTPPQ